MSNVTIQILRVIAVVALLCAAAAFATPRGRLPLVLRGLKKTLGGKKTPADAGEKVPSWRKTAAFLQVMAAFCLAVSIFEVPSEGDGGENDASAAFQSVGWTVMGTVANVKVRGDTERTRQAAEIVRDVFADVERLLNAHDPQSELSRLAALPDAAVLSNCTARVRPCYEAAFELKRLTDGAFDPRWRGTNTLDLGAIAKGFAVDRAAAELRRRGAPETLVDLGGNLKAAGGAWRVGVQDPATFGRAGRPARVLRLEAGAACATSAEYARGKHIFDGRTGNAVSNGVSSVTVVHPSSAMKADGLSTVLFIFGREKGAAWLRRHAPEAQAHFL